ncbi:MAG: dethiobiotin synthase, partial [Pseudomonadota bacterium]|nr:dethiobiotin synthase [Pseudomonadota bacterium]
MAKQTFFIAGTDTEVGKTLISTGLLAKAAELNKRTVGLKPVAAGCEETADGWRNEDALALQQAMTEDLDYEQINPVALREAIAPHLAAAHEGKQLSASRLMGFCRGVMMLPSDFVIVEGAGGWRVPLNPRETLAHLAIELNAPVILVVGMKLGCINHALLTAEAIRRDGLPLAGWVANRVEPEMSCYEENVATLRSLIGAPLLGEVPHLSDVSPESVAQHL